MFKIFIISAWSIALTASFIVGLFVVLAFTFSLWASSSTFLLNIFNSLSSQPYTTFLNNDSPLVVNSTSLEAKQWQTYLILAVIVIVIISLIAITIMELLRLKKSQKLSKPFVKVYIVILAILSLLIGQVILIVFATMLLINFILLETILFDSEALNNYAEERNLISIYREERKFEREVAKEGKLIDNVDLKQNNQTNFQSKNEQVKVNDSSTLSDKSEQELDNYFKKSKIKKNYLNWKNYKQKLEEIRIRIEQSSSDLTNEKKLKTIRDFNNEVLKVNDLAKRLNIPYSYYMDYILNEDLQKEDEDQYVEENINFKSNIISETTSVFGGEPSTSINDSIEEIYDLYSEMDKEIDMLLNDELQSLQLNSKHNGLDKEFIDEKMAKAVNMDLSQLPEGNLSDLNEKDIYNDFNFEQKDLTVNSISILNLDKQENASLSMNAQNFTIIKDLEEDYIKNEELQKTENLDLMENAFVIPQTKLHIQKKFNNGLEQEFIDEKMAKAVNMELSQLPEGNLSDLNEKEIYNDFGFEQKDLTVNSIPILNLDKQENASLSMNAQNFTIIKDLEEDYIQNEELQKTENLDLMENAFVIPQSDLNNEVPMNKNFEQEFNINKKDEVQLYQIHNKQLPDFRQEETNSAQGDLTVSSLPNLNLDKKEDNSLSTNVQNFKIIRYLEENIFKNEEIQKTQNLDSVENTFVIPQNNLKAEVRVSDNFGQKLEKEKTKKIIDMELSQLPEGNLFDLNEKDIYNDFGFEQEDLTVSSLPNLNLVEKNEKESLSANISSFSASSMPIIGNLEIQKNTNNTEESKIKNNENEISNFSEPKKDDKILSSKLAEDKFLIEKMSRAINMDLNQLHEGYFSDSDENEIYNDFNLANPNLASQNLIKHLEKTKEYNKNLSNLSNKSNIEYFKKQENDNVNDIKNDQELNISNPPIFNESEIGNMPLNSKNNLSFETDLEYKEEFDLVGANKPYNFSFADKEIIFEESLDIFEDDDEEFINIQLNDSNDVFDKNQNQLQNHSDLEKFQYINDEKILKLEERIINLEQLINNLNEQLRGEWMHEEFIKISQKLDKFTSELKELKEKTPKKIIDTLSTRHIYNRK